MSDAKRQMIQVADLEPVLWAAYKREGDFAFAAPDLATDPSGMFHVKLSEWEIVSENEDKATGLVTVRLRARGVDDEGRLA